MKDLYRFLPEEMEQLVIDMGYPRYRADQILLSLYYKFPKTFSEIKQLPKKMREDLIEAGYEVYLVNPRETEILGKKVYDRVQDLPKPVDIVDIFRKPADVLPVVEDAIESAAGAIWMQLEIVNQEAAELAQASGLEVVMDRCTKIEHRKIS